MAIGRFWIYGWLAVEFSPSCFKKKRQTFPPRRKSFSLFQIHVHQWLKSHYFWDFAPFVPFCG